MPRTLPPRSSGYQILYLISNVGSPPTGKRRGHRWKLSGRALERDNLARRRAVDVVVELRAVVEELRVGRDDVPAAHVAVAVAVVPIGASVTDRRRVEPGAERRAALLERPPLELSVLPRRVCPVAHLTRRERHRGCLAEHELAAAASGPLEVRVEVGAEVLDKRHPAHAGAGLGRLLARDIVPAVLHVDVVL